MKEKLQKKCDLFITRSCHRATNRQLAPGACSERVIGGHQSKSLRCPDNFGQMHYGASFLYLSLRLRYMNITSQLQFALLSEACQSW